MIDADTVRALLRTKVSQYETLKQAGNALGIEPKHLGKILNGHYAPGLLLLKRLGLRRVIAYEPVGE